ncbi:ribonuclease H-like domain-containing protein [Tanacetum coccineum]
MRFLRLFKEVWRSKSSSDGVVGVGGARLKYAKKESPCALSLAMKFPRRLNGSEWVRVNVDSVSPIASASAGAEGHIPPKTAEQKLARKNKLKAKSTLMLAILDEHLLKFHACKDAKSLWKTIKKRFGGNKESKKMQKTILKQNYENFAASSQEGLDTTYDRFQKLISQLEIHGEVISHEDANLKLLRSLPSAWNNIALIMRNKSNLDTLSMDDLYNNLKVYESEIKGKSSSSSNSHNVAFVSSDNSSSTNETVNTAHRRKIYLNDRETVGFDKTKVECYNCYRRCHFARECRAPRNQRNRNRDALRRNAPVDTSTTNALIVQDGIGGYDWRFQAEEGIKNFALMALDSSFIKFIRLESLEARIVIHEKNEVVYEEDIAFLSRESDMDNSLVIDRFKTGEGFHAVPPPYTRNYIISKTSKDVIEKPKTVRPSAPIIEEWDTDTVATKSGQVPVNAAKQSSLRAAASISTVRPVNTATPKPKGNLQYTLQDQGIFDSGYSRHMTGNKSLQIIKKLMVDLLHLEEVLKEVKLLEKVILELLLDESQVMLKVSRHDNMYSFDLKNVVLSGVTAGNQTNKNAGKDVEELYRLVKERYSASRPEGYDLMLWGDLHTLFEPDEEDEIWKNQHEYNVISWSLYDFCGIHILLMQNGIAIHMLTENKYPLSQEMISKMLKNKLEVDYESSQAFELLRFIEDVITKKIVYHLFDDEVEFLRCVILSYLLVLEITCSCFHDFIDKDLIDLVLPDVRRLEKKLPGLCIRSPWLFDLDHSFSLIIGCLLFYTLWRFSFKQRKGIRVYTEPSLPEVQGAAFSEGPHVNTIGNMQARHNQLLNTTYVILEEYGALLQQLQTGSDPRLYGPTVKEVVQLPVEESVDQNSSISVFFRITMWISHSMYGPFESRLSVVSNGHCNENCEEILQHEPYGISKEPEEVLEVRGQGELNTYKVLKAHLIDSLHAGLALGDLNSVKDLYDFKTLSVLFLIGFISIVPTILKRKRIYK